MKAVVLGATGFLGLNLVEALKAAGHDVVATRRPSSNTIYLRRFKVPLKSVRLEDPESLVAAMDGAEVAFFSAGHYPRLSIDTEKQVEQGVRGLKNALEAARQAGVRRFVYTGSVATVAHPKDGRPAVEADGLIAKAPQGSTYYAVKLAMDHAIDEAVAAGQDVVTLMPTGCFGPYDHKVGTGFFIVALANRALATYVEGRTNIVDARDVALGHLAAATKGRAGERYILGGTNLGITDLLQKMAEQYDVPPPGCCMPAAEALAYATAEEARCHGTPNRPAMSREMVDMALEGQFVDVAKARTELDFNPRPLEETLTGAFEWYRQNGYIRIAA
ncbi:MAG: NAD-dependent epimerase/dehydratase family protein [Myxococcales bacterium]